MVGGPTCGPFLILSRGVKLCGPPSSRGYASTWPNYEALLILSPAMKRWGLPRRQGLRYVATRPTCLPLLISFPALKRFGPPRQ